MSKSLHYVQITYGVMVAAEVDEKPEDVARNHLDLIVENEEPSCTSIESVYSVSSTNKWYDKVPYGDTEGHPSQYYSTKEVRDRRDVVSMVRSTLTEKEWETLKLHFSAGARKAKSCKALH